MDTLKTIGISALVALVVAGGLTVAFPKQTQQVVQTLGSVASPDIPSPYLNWGGVYEWHANSKSLASATTTPFAAQSPINATSTLQLGSGCNFTVSSTSAKAVRFYKATTAYATTTFLFGANIAANAQGAPAATTTTDNFVFAPGTYLVMDMEGGTGVDSPTGSCSASWIAL